MSRVNWIAIASIIITLSLSAIGWFTTFGSLQQRVANNETDLRNMQQKELVTKSDLRELKDDLTEQLKEVREDLKHLRRNR